MGHPILLGMGYNFFYLLIGDKLTNTFCCQNPRRRLVFHFTFSGKNNKNNSNSSILFLLKLKGVQIKSLQRYIGLNSRTFSVIVFYYTKIDMQNCISWEYPQSPTMAHNYWSGIPTNANLV